jgi:hypothetical protein
MPVIRITDSTWSRLQRWAVPLEDSPEDAVKKVLDAAEEHLKCPQKSIPPHDNSLIEKPKRTGHKLTKGLSTTQSAYRTPILEALYELGGRAPNQDVLKIVETKMRSLLTEIDYKNVPSGRDIRWSNAARWARYSLIKDGKLKPDSPRGIWELSDNGMQEVERIAKTH